MIIALAQINTTQGNVPQNMVAIREAVEQAAEQGARLVIFPELALCGYCPRDVLFLEAFQSFAEKSLIELAKSLPTGVAALVGSIKVPETKSGRRVYNSAFLLEGNSVRAVCNKRHLPNYDVFDEARHFVPGKSNDILTLDGLNLGITICEDIWGQVGQDPGMPRYEGDPAKELLDAGAQCIINLSASPFHSGKIQQRDEVVASQARRLGVPLVLCNLVGGNDEVIFDGSSIAVDHEGHPIAIAKSFEEDLVVFDLNATKTGTRKTLHENEEMRRALVLGLRDYAHKSGFKRAVLGLSGGIDSALTAAIAAEAFGAKNVLGVSMPSKYSADMSHDDAKSLAENLGMSFEVIPIKNVFDATLAMLQPHFEGKDEDVTEENIQPRIRGMYLMALSNKHHALLLATGNKSELSVGYCTLYGDMCGGLAVISDLPKHKVYDLSRHINEHAGREIIPERTITRPPSAELRPDQKDSDSLPDYDDLDEILRLAVEEGKGAHDIIEAGFASTDVKDVLNKLWLNEFKRKQMPPGLKVTAKAFGVGRRMPLTGGARWLNNEETPSL